MAWAREAWEAKKRGSGASPPAVFWGLFAVAVSGVRGLGLWLLPTPSPPSAEITSHLLPRPPRLLLLVNPFGGRGLAWQLCKNHVLPMISEAGLSFNLIQTGKGGVRTEGEGLGPISRVLGRGRACLTSRFPTSERQNHARELVQGLSLSEWDGIVTVSGDGLLYEVGQEAWALSPGGDCGGQDQYPGIRFPALQVLNGLLDRPDWEEAMKTPVGILPCGSGNALAGAVNQHGG